MRGQKEREQVGRGQRGREQGGRKQEGGSITLTYFPNNGAADRVVQL